MAEPRRLERLTAQDLLMLLADDFGWFKDIGVAILDGTRLLDADGRVRVDEVRRRLEPRLHLVPRASGSCCTGRDGDWAGLCGSTPHLRPRRPRAGPPGAGTRRRGPAAGGVRLAVPAAAGPDPAAVAGLAPARPAMAGRPVPPRPPHHGGRRGRGGGPRGRCWTWMPTCAHAGRAAVDPGAGPERRRAVPRQPAPAPAGGWVAGCRAWPICRPRGGSSGVWREFLAERAPAPASTA